MPYLIVRVYGAADAPGGGEFFTAPQGARTPAVYPTLEALAVAYREEHRRQQLWKNNDPARGVARLLPVAAEQVPQDIRTCHHGRPHTRYLQRQEKLRLAQLAPEYRP